ncbi:MAG: enoyl-CoA hydratase/isomerase family protein, partial [Rhodospirillales bacterium]|nr:enoyl-CoA hydratase/isomerase family protein [Rhodospirillales bacterium]
MANIECEHADDCLRIRIACGTANALTTAVIQDLAHAVADANRNARGAMLCGGEKFFCNGLDLDWALTCSRAEITEMFHELAGLILAMLESPLPIVGAIRGHAIGGGMA